MKTLMLVGVAVLGLCFAGCGNKTETTADGTNAVGGTDKVSSGSQPKPSDPNEVVVAIGDAKLTRGEIDAEVSQFIEMQMANIPPEQRSQIPPTQVERVREQFAEQYKQRFITKTLLTNEAAKKGLSVTDADITAFLNDLIKNIKGRPGAPATPEEFLEKHPMGAARVREEIKTEVLVKKLVEKEIEPKVVVDQEELKKQYNMIVSNITAQVKAVEPGQVRASHILVMIGEKKTDADAKKEIDALYAQLKDLTGDALKKKFAELAKEKSDCPSKEMGGDLLHFGRGKMAPEFEKASFEQAVGKIYEPIKTRFGWHLVLVTENPAKPFSDAEVAKIVDEQKPKLADLEQMMKNRQVQQKFQEYLEGLLEANGFQSPKSQVPAAPQRLPRSAPQPKPAGKVESKPVALPSASATNSVSATKSVAPGTNSASATPVTKTVEPAPATKTAASPAKTAAPAKPAEAKK